MMGREAIKLASYVLLLGYHVIWIMAPTNTYRQKWMPRLMEKLNSSYFGRQGFTLLVYSFPVLLVSILGCVYLHLVKKPQGGSKIQRNGKEEHHRLSKYWKRPMLVKGPLGIVSGIELAFFLMFIALLVWSLAVYLRNGFATVSPQSLAIKEEKAWEAKLEKAGLRLGFVGNICLALLFFPVTRGSSVLPLFGLTSESSIKYHIWLGHLAMLFFTAHGVAYILYWSVTNQMSQTLEWSKTRISNVAGEISLMAGLFLWGTTFSSIRRKIFELFFYTHYLYILFMVFFVFHVGITYTCISLFGFYLFLIDRYLRFLQSRRNVCLVSARVLPCQTIELNFWKQPDLSCSPASIMFLKVPSISKLQWHPFTISSNSNIEPDILSVVIKSEGSWTQRLINIVSSSTSKDHLSFAVEGPYGPACTNFLRHDILVMVCGGSGITPFISIIREFMFASRAHKCKTPEVILICAFKYSSELTMLDLILPISETGTSHSLSNLKLKIKAYVTREKEPTTNDLKQIQSIWFQPSETESPISATLGPNSWLWLAAIISSSFILFLIIVSLITHYYIYPIDQNSELVFSRSLRVFFNMLVLCSCILATASAAFFWNKKQYENESNQILNMEMSTSAESLDAFAYNGDRELESFSLQTLAQVTQVRYGERPNLKVLLSELKGSGDSSVGVLVCGPKALRDDVASFCSSGSTDNLYFESISFSW